MAHGLVHRGSRAPSRARLAWPSLERAEPQQTGVSVVPRPFNLSLSAVAHDLRGPVAALATASELLAEEVGGLSPTQIRERLQSMQRRAIWLQELVENLLCASTIREGRFALRTHSVDLVELILEIEGVVQPLLSKKRQHLVVSAPGMTGVLLTADGRRIGQVLVNLVLNASQFGPDGMTILISVSQKQNGTIRCTVSDRGPGISNGEAVRLFAPYYQGADHAAGGVGLGLAIVREIIAAHGGEVGATSRPGGGAEFWFALPGAPTAVDEERT